MSGRLKTGLVSVTFRKLGVEEIVRLVQDAGLDGIEWGGDVHVPAGDTGRAKEVGRMTREAGLEVLAYGSYYRMGQGGDFAPVVETAVALGAPLIRVWAGVKGSKEATAEERAKVVADGKAMAEMAQRAGVMVCSEWHAGTLTDEVESGVRFLEEVGHEHFRTLWQPTNGAPTEACLATLRRVLGWVENVHCFHWWPTNKEWHALSEGAERWGRYLEMLRGSGRGHGVLLEFVKDHEVGQFKADARTLKEWVNSYCPVGTNEDPR